MNHPSLNAAYEKLHPGHFRLLRILNLEQNGQIHCELASVAVHEAGEYDALSYAWNGETPSITITCNGNPFRITPVLHGALCMFYEQHGSRPVWADAICINQADLEEKAKQVPMMEEIYSKAHTVVIWLGPAGSHTDLAADSITSLTDILGKYDREIVGASRDANIPGLEHLVWSGLREIFERPWFTRLWTLQEIVLGQRLLVCCGTKRIQWHELIELVKMLRRAGLIQRLTSTDVRFIGSVTSTQQPEFLRVGRAEGIGDYPLSYLVKSSIVRHVTEPVDRVYALLGLADPVIRSKITVDYSPSCRREYWKLYLAVAHLMIHETGDMRVLLQVTAKDPQDRLVQLPSWCPNFNAMCLSSLPIRTHSIEGISPIARKASYLSTSGDGRKITLQLCPFDEIRSVTSFAYQTSPGMHRGPDGNCSQMHTWLEDCHALTGRDLPGHATAEPSLLRAFIADTFQVSETGTFRPAPDDEQIRRGYMGMVEYLRAYRDGLSWTDTGQSQEDGRLVNTFMKSLDFVCNRRRLYISKRGLFGMAPDSTRPGDLVCYYRGCDMLLVVRPRPGEDGFEFVGETWLQGVMRGELFDDEGQLLDGRMKERAFTLS